MILGSQFDSPGCGGVVVLALDTSRSVFGKSSHYPLGMRAGPLLSRGGVQGRAPCGPGWKSFRKDWSLKSCYDMLPPAELGRREDCLLFCSAQGSSPFATGFPHPLSGLGHDRFHRSSE